MKKKRIIFLRIVSIIDMLGIMLLSSLIFGIIGGFFIFIILCTLCILIQSDFYKIVDKLGINIMFFLLLLISFLIFGGIGILGTSTYSTDLSRNWNNIKADFQIINEQTIEYFENNKVNTIHVYEYKKTLNSEQREVFERASKNYSKYNDYGNEITIIENIDGVISYYDWEGNGYFERIVYSKLSKSEIRKLLNKGDRDYIIEDLGDNWYYLDEHHR